MTQFKSLVESSGDPKKDFEHITKYIKNFNSNFAFYKSPYFRRYFSSINIGEVVDFYKSYNYIANCGTIESVWGNVPFDYFQTYQHILSILPLYELKQNARDWLSKNTTVSTYLNMIQMYYSKHGIQKTETMYSDTLNQLVRLIDKKSVPTQPKRWRLDEFHDHISHLYLESTVENKKHDCEFIPCPIQKGKFKIYQPRDTLQLAIWGKRVHNCVLSYEEKIFQKESAIILVEEEDTPKYTFELRYNFLKKGQIQISQSVGIGNSSIPQEESTTLQKLIQEAIQSK